MLAFVYDAVLPISVTLGNQQVKGICAKVDTAIVIFDVFKFN